VHAYVVRAFVSACVRIGCVGACARARVRACLGACMRACAIVRMSVFSPESTSATTNVCVCVCVCVL
jgi:hypothetical protein